MPARIILLVASIVPLFLASCVVSVHPLSDDKTSTIDERLYGRWLEVSDNGREEIVTVGRSQKGKNTLEWVSVTRNSDHTLMIERGKLFVLRRGKIDFLSFELQNKKERGFVLGKYELPDAKTLRLYVLDRNVIGAAIVKGQLKGKVTTLFGSDVANSKSSPPKDTDRSRSYDFPALTDSPEAILRFVEKNSAKCFADPVTFKRISD